MTSGISRTRVVTKLSLERRLVSCRLLMPVPVESCCSVPVQRGLGPLITSMKISVLVMARITVANHFRTMA